MAEGFSGTVKLMAKAAGLLAGQNAWIGFDKGSMDSFTVNTNALTLEATETGVARAAATVTNITTTVAQDTTRWTTTFTVGASVTLMGAGLLSANAAGDLRAWHRWAGAVNTQSGDTITQTFSNAQVTAV